MNPKKANPKSFNVDKIIYNTIALSICTDEDKHIAMHWNHEEGGPGHPKTSGHLMSFLRSDELRLTMLRSKVGLKDIQKKNC